MADLQLMRTLQRPASSKIVLLLIDGLGGIPSAPGGETELEAAPTPNLDRLAAEGTLGQIIPIRHGITPGSGPAHLALFGYDPLAHEVGRGVLEAAGIGMRVSKGDVAARGNLCTVDPQGKITDRRAGRISSNEAAPLIERLAKLALDQVEVEARHVRDYRFAVVMRGNGLLPDLEDTDPQQTGIQPYEVRARSKEAQPTADLFNTWIAGARKALLDQPRANAFTLRGFSTDPQLPPFPEVYGLRSACIAVYPMYKGVACLLGMDVLKIDGESAVDEFNETARVWKDYDFFFIHFKKTDSRGEDGDFEGKAAAIAELDQALPSLLSLDPDVLVVTGDHSTPSRLRVHSWHPVPLLLWAPATGRPDGQSRFGERTCAMGGFGTLMATDVMPLAMAHAGRLEKYGA